MEGREERDFISVLREHDLQVTYQRLAIYQALYYSKEHPSAEIIHQQIKKKFPMISLGTVYKTLEKFYEVGLIKKVSPLTEVNRYDATLDPHYHLVCLRCQRIQDCQDFSFRPQLYLAEKSGFKVISHEVLFQGYCSECVKTQ